MFRNCCFVYSLYFHHHHDSTLPMLCLILLGCVIATNFAYGRTVISRLAVNNGGEWGSWGHEDFCERGSYAIGYSMKIEEPIGRGDDTSLNGIKLICGDSVGRRTGSHAISSSGPWGEWFGDNMCERGQFISAFRLQVEEWQGNGDDTAANYMRVRCRNFGTHTGEYERFMGDGYGYWGSYRSWSSSCPAHSAVCGIKTSVEVPQGNGDDTALNDVILICCSWDE